MQWIYDYLGKPWLLGGEGPDAYDCYGLVRAVYRTRLQLDLPIVTFPQPQPLAIRHRIREESANGWQQFSQAQELDVLLMGQAAHPHHVGIWLPLNNGSVLHALSGIGVVCQPVCSLAGHGWRIHGIFRRAR